MDGNGKVDMENDLRRKLRAIAAGRQKGKAYPMEIVIKALRLRAEDGLSLRGVAKALGIADHGTVGQWQRRYLNDDEFYQRVNEARRKQDLSANGRME